MGTTLFSTQGEIMGAIVPPTPHLILETIYGYQRTAALRSAVELDIFTAIAQGAKTPVALAEQIQASERGLRVLCDYLVIIGLLQKNNGTYSLTPDTAVFLDRRSPAYMGGVVKWMTSPSIVDASRDLAAVVRQGRTLLPEQGSVTPNNPLWVEFARNMVALMKPTAEAIAHHLDAKSGEPWKVLDIAAGHGVFGITLASLNPHAEIVALDWPEVLAVARENAEAAGVSARYHTLAGSAFDVDFGTDYDLVLITNFFHHFDLPTCKPLMEKIHQALKPKGKAATLEFIPNSDRVTPPQTAAFSMHMLMTTPSGDAYTFAEYEQMFRDAGFPKSELHAIAQSAQQLIVSYK
jgi:ubiquinone/menaquinone biosynthesis C-methylase UbiE